MRMSCKSRYHPTLLPLQITSPFGISIACTHTVCIFSVVSTSTSHSRRFFIIELQLANKLVATFPTKPQHIKPKAPHCKGGAFGSKVTQLGRHVSYPQFCTNVCISQVLQRVSIGAIIGKDRCAEPLFRWCKAKKSRTKIIAVRGQKWLC